MMLALNFVCTPAPLQLSLLACLHVYKMLSSPPFLLVTSRFLFLPQYICFSRYGEKCDNQNRSTSPSILTKHYQ